LPIIRSSTRKRQKRSSSFEDFQHKNLQNKPNLRERREVSSDGGPILVIYPANPLRLPLERWARLLRLELLAICVAYRSGKSRSTGSALFRKHATAILSARAAIDSIQQRYFAGRDILLESSAESWKTMADEIVSLALMSDANAPPAEAGQPSDCWLTELLDIRKSIDPTSIVNALIPQPGTVRSRASVFQGGIEGLQANSCNLATKQI
jgi:hypothetical protein